MTTIDCSLNCVHQNDGRCMLDNVVESYITITSDCVFFKEKGSKNQKPSNLKE